MLRWNPLVWTTALLALTQVSGRVIPTISSSTSTPSIDSSAAALNSVVPGELPRAAASSSITPGNLPLAFVNNFAGGAINAYLTGQDDQGKVVFVKKDGTFFRPSTFGDVTEDVSIPLGAQGSTTQLKTPGYIQSGRIWFAQGTLKFAMDGANLVQPSPLNPKDASAGTNWGFVEFTYSAASGVYANLSFVDFLGLILGIGLQNTDGSQQTAKGLQPDSVSAICGLLKTQGSKDGQPWGSLCANDGNGKPLRILSPGNYISINKDAYSTYWKSYVDQVWQKYTSQPLKIVTQAAAGTVACKVQGDQLTCPGAARGYAKPNAMDIFGCNTGPFGKQAADNPVNLAVTSRLCAAFDRSTLLLDGGDTQPGSTAYYNVDPTNYYSKFVHQHEVDGRGYAFAYDDVTPTGGEDKSGVLTNPHPQLLTVYVGGAK
ncbi:hypothetical protein AMS68_001313 [Peltaster fructicola]|uniref:GH64 domain-containing protein n=1 Tax=Peltaster fructicola TaxID=286661 RepID=A0A6H0XM63_9PEZI|nr:hypothetical protein AMS68_001313 [Peltaster fructicola]